MSNPTEIAKSLLQTTNKLLYEYGNCPPNIGQGEDRQVLCGVEAKSISPITNNVNASSVVENCHLHKMPNPSKKWKSKILMKIESLERELDEMREAYEQRNYKQGKPLKDYKEGAKSQFCLARGSSQSSSPIKSNRRQSGKMSRGSDGRDESSALRNEMTEAKQVMDRGFRTARELNEKLELWKRKQKVRKDVALQVSLPTKEESSDDDVKICYLAKKLTNLLLEKPHKPKKKKCLRHNVGQSALISQIDEESGNRNRLAVQRLPDNCIRDSLSTKSLPTIVIAPSNGVQASADNTRLYFFNHNNSTQNSSVSSKSLPKARNKPAAQIRTDVGLQVDLSDSSSGDVTTHESKSLEIKHKLSYDIYNETQILKDLLKKVEETEEQCKKYGNLKSSLSTSLKSTNSSFSDSMKKISSVVEADDYKRDFEVESLDKDVKSPTSLSKISLMCDNAQERLTKTPSIGSIASISKVADNIINVTRSNTLSNFSTDESLLEAQMKRLGISPERGTAVRKPKSSSKTIKNSAKSKRILSPKFQSSPLVHPKTLYMKSEGKFIPVEPLESPNVQIIVPEIVVKLPETSVKDLSYSTSRHNHSEKKRQDRVIQTDEGFDTLTLGDASAVVGNINKHFERTQLLLERIGPLPGIEPPSQANVLSLLHRRIPKEQNCAKHGLKTSPGEITRHGWTPARSKNIFDADGLESANDRSQSIGEVTDHYR